MPETKKRPLDTMETGENSSESKGEHEIRIRFSDQEHYEWHR